jgi:hypothetical protein
MGQLADIVKTRLTVFVFREFKIYLAPQGGLAQLARALPWHGRGHRFDSDILHKKVRNRGLFCLQAPHRPPGGQYFLR